MAGKSQRNRPVDISPSREDELVSRALALEAQHREHLLKIESLTGRLGVVYREAQAGLGVARTLATQLEQLAREESRMATKLALESLVTRAEVLRGHMQEQSNRSVSCA
jgi:hypothetical protein